MDSHLRIEKILEDFNLVLNDGDKAVIIGEEGNGKSTLMKWLYDPLFVDDYMEANGKRMLGQLSGGLYPAKEKAGGINNMILHVAYY